MKRSIIREILWILSLLVFGTGFGVLAIYFFGTPSVKNIADYPLNQTTIFYDRTGEHELYRLYGEENRTVIRHDAIPASVRLATLAAEDAHFYTHHGIDIFAILRALKVDILSGEFKQGGSTITQQLARSLYLTRDRTVERKIREMFLAIKIDQNFSKDEILDLYLNTVPYGSNAYGIEVAAETFFNKKARDLNLAESAFLAALPNAPTYFSPYGGQKKQLRIRQLDILDRMHDLDFITEQELEQAQAVDILAAITPLSRPIVAPHFVFYVIEQLEKTYSRATLETAGMKIYTSIDLPLQDAALHAIETNAKKNLAWGASNAGLVALDPKSGEILAMVGSKDYFDASIDGNVNITTRARQPGSAFKPFAYAKAFEKGFQPETPIVDRPINFGPDGSGRPYIPNNYDGRFHGLMTMRQALSMSLNVPAVQTLALAGVADTIELATRLGITTLTDPKRYGLALVLGGAEVRPIDMASAFSVFSQDGIRYELRPVLKIISQDDPEITAKQDPNGFRVLDADIARKINSILSDNVARTPIFGPRSPLAFPSGVTVAAKTGTTQNFRDAWTVGYTPSIAAAVWAGNNDNRPMAAGADGVFVAAPIWRAFMNAALTQFPKTGFVPYEKVIALPQATDNPEESQVIYFDKKTGREISPEKAKKLKKSRVEKRVVNEFAPEGFDLDSTSSDALVPFDAIRAAYFSSASKP
jgi:penicillin-binding protein 1C